MIRSWSFADDIAGLSRCPSCKRAVTPEPKRPGNHPRAFRCLFCPSIVCDWCYSEGHTKPLHADLFI